MIFDRRFCIVFLFGKKKENLSSIHHNNGLMSRRCLVMSESKIVEIERSVGGCFGFSVIGGVDTELPPMVCALVHNGSAQLSGKVGRLRFDTVCLNTSSCQPALVSQLCY